jgi:hypothetical protein
MSSNTDNIFQALTPIILALSAVIAGIAIWVQQIYAKRQSNIEAMKNIFGILSESGHKTAEKNIRENYEKGDLDSIKATYNDGASSVVRRNYDQIGAMKSSNLIPDTEYYRTFGVLTIVSYFILKESILIERKDHKYHMAHFTNLAIDCFNFWDKQEEDDKPKITDPRNKPITKNMLGEKIKLPKKRWWKS